MAAGDFKTIDELVRVNCHVDLDDSANQILYQGVMFCEPAEYINCARKRNQAQAEELFNWDLGILELDYKYARPL